MKITGEIQVLSLNIGAVLTEVDSVVINRGVNATFETDGVTVSVEFSALRNNDAIEAIYSSFISGQPLYCIEINE